MYKSRKNQGQIMLMSVLLICGAVLGASALASTLVIQQIRKSAAAGESARAVFAADAGIEAALRYRYHERDPISGNLLCESGDAVRDGVLYVDGEQIAEYTVRITGCSSADSLGESGRSARAFHVSFDGLCEWGQSEACD